VAKRRKEGAEVGGALVVESVNLLRVKEQLLNLRPGYDSGCTAVVAFLDGTSRLVVANAGDSRCVVLR
jgi:serine/threonine protein phosphatase PrpC